jgi:hypothetical protein
LQIKAKWWCWSDWNSSLEAPTREGFFETDLKLRMIVIFKMQRQWLAWLKEWYSEMEKREFCQRMRDGVWMYWLDCSWPWDRILWETDN